MEIFTKIKQKSSHSAQQVVFEGVTKIGYEGDMAIDDIEVSMGLCTKPGWFLFKFTSCPPILKKSPICL